MDDFGPFKAQRVLWNLHLCGWLQLEDISWDAMKPFISDRATTALVVLIELQERLHTTYNNGDPERKDASGRNKHWTPCGWIKKCAEIQSKKENWGRCDHGGPRAPAKKRKLSARNLSMVS